MLVSQAVENAMLCPHCADGRNAAWARRVRVLQLLALIEHPDALPPAAALRVAGELLDWLGPDEACERPVEAPRPRAVAEASA